MSNRTGYYYHHGKLFHCHTASSGDSQSQWHEARNAHPATPFAHNMFQCFNTELAVWSRANTDLTRTEKDILIGEAEEAAANSQNGTTNCVG